MENPVRTKIISTIGPASSTEEKITALIQAGTKVFRINSSHGKKEEHEQNIDKIRKISKELNLFIPIILDLQGPKIRIGNLKEPVCLKDGSRITLKPGMESDNSDIIPVDYPGIMNDLKEGEKMLLDDGKISLKAISISEDIIEAEVIHGGLLTSRKGLNLPGTQTSVSALTDRDIDFIKFAVEKDIDYIALSFVRNQEDVIQAKGYIEKFGGNIPVISKIEKPQALDNLSSIISVSDGLMVARGDLGIEISPEKVPLMQKHIIEQANSHGKDVITATQMLETMIKSPTPTRAETSDIANAIIDGTDAVMLSGETAVGDYPVEAVSMMRSIAENVEISDMCKCNRFALKAVEPMETDSYAIASAVIRMLSEVKVDAIIAFTRTGYTAKLLSKAKPTVPVIAITDNETVCRRLNLYWGVFPHLLNFELSLNENLLKEMDNLLINETFLKTGNKTIITGGLPYLVAGKTNFLRLHQIGTVE